MSTKITFSGERYSDIIDAMVDRYTCLRLGRSEGQSLTSTYEKYSGLGHLVADYCNNDGANILTTFIGALNYAYMSDEAKVAVELLIKILDKE